MAWTYGDDPENSTRDEVRFLVGDTDTSDQLVSDAEIAYALAEEANSLLAAAKVAKAIMAKFARLVDKAVGDLKISYGQRSAAYKELVDQLTERGMETAGIPFAGGISISDKDSREDDTDRVDPTFTRGMHQHNVNEEDPLKCNRN